jgi:glycosyltransferase involved in cell wall biosynthesis
VTSPINVIANGIDTTRFAPNSSTTIDCETAAPTILFVGRLVDGKRPESVINALPSIRSAVPDARVVICGDGPLRSELSARAVELSVDDAVAFRGTVPYDEMPAIYRSADVLVLPSEMEGLPRTVLESLATETPVVTSDLPQLTDIVDGVGRTIPTGDSAALADVVIELLTDDHLRERFGKRGRERVTEQFEWTDTVRKTTSVLEQLTNR